MRIVSYNIFDGGEGRADPIGEIIEAQRPDIVALIEADDLAVIERIARRLKMDYIVGEGDRHSVAVLSRWPIVDSLNHAAWHERPDCLVETTIREPAGREWIVGALHLHARAYERDEQIREQEIATVLDVFARHRQSGRGHLLVGDFNANSPIQRIEPQQCKPATRKAWEENGGRIPRRVIQRLMDVGYADTLAAGRDGLAATAGSFTTQFPGQRVDYIFAWLGDAKVRDSWIEQDRLAKYASDHYPIGAELE